MRFGFIPYTKKPLIIAHSGLSRETRCLKVVRSLLKLSYFVYARSESSGEVMRICKFVGAFATRRCNENHHLVRWPIYSFIFSLQTIILFSLFSFIIWIVQNFETLSERIYLDYSVSLLSKLIRDARYVQVYSCKAFHRWKNTLCLTDVQGCVFAENRPVSIHWPDYKCNVF